MSAAETSLAQEDALMWLRGFIIGLRVFGVLADYVSCDNVQGLKESCLRCKAIQLILYRTSSGLLTRHPPTSLRGLPKRSHY